MTTTKQQAGTMLRYFHTPHFHPSYFPPPTPLLSHKKKQTNKQKEQDKEIT